MHWMTKSHGGWNVWNLRVFSNLCINTATILLLNPYIDFSAFQIQSKSTCYARKTRVYVAGNKERISPKWLTKGWKLIRKECPRPPCIYQAYFTACTRHISPHALRQKTPCTMAHAKFQLASFYHHWASGAGMYAISQFSFPMITQ